MRPNPLLAATSSLTLLVACSSGSGSGGMGGEGAGSALSGEERATFETGALAAPTMVQLGSLAEAFFHFDPTLDPSQTPEQNAAAIQAQLTGAASGCGTVTLSGDTVTAAFGAPPGCTLDNGSTISGTVVAVVGKSGATLTVSLTFTSVVFNGKDLSGNATFATATGNTFAVSANLASGGTSYTATNLTIGGNAGTTTINGAMSEISSKGTSVMVTFTNVTWKIGQCYPNGGTMKVTKGAITTVVTFSGTTPTSGEVTVSVGKKSSTEALPGYGECGGAG